MPRPCAVEPHARCYQKGSPLLKMPRPGAVEAHACGFHSRNSRNLDREFLSLYENRVRVHSRFIVLTTVFCSKAMRVQAAFLAASVRLHGTRPWHLKKGSSGCAFLAASVRLHGTRPWHLKKGSSG